MNEAYYGHDAFNGKVAPDSQVKGVWLSKAAIALAEPNTQEVLKGLQEAKARFAELRHGETPEAFDMLSKNSTSDREADLSLEERTALKRYRGYLSALRGSLMSRLRFGNLMAFGDRDRPGADPEWIPTRSWMHLDPNPDNKDAVSGDAGAYWYVRVVDPTDVFATTTHTPDANPGQPVAANEPVWFDPAEAYTLIAFGDPKPVLRWDEFEQLKPTRRWRFDPPSEIIELLEAQIAGQEWIPSRPPSNPPEDFAADIQRVVDETGVSRKELLQELYSDEARKGTFYAAVDAARDKVVALVKDRKLIAFGRPAHDLGKSDNGAFHAPLPFEVFLSGVATIAWDGWVRVDLRKPLEVQKEWRGPYFDEVRFSAAEIRNLLPYDAPTRTDDVVSLVPHTPQPIGPGSQPLLEIAVRLRPRWCHVWLLTAQCNSLKELERAKFRVALRFPNLREFETINHLGQEIEARKRQVEYRRKHILRSKIEPSLRGALESGQFAFRGTLANGESRDIEARIARTCSFDIENNTITSSGGGPVWHDVTATIVLSRATESSVGEKVASARSADVLTSWRGAGSSVVVEESFDTMRTIAVKKRPTPTNQAVTSWIENRVQSWPDDKPAPSENVDWTAVSHFFDDGLTRDNFREFRRKIVPPEWQKQGRRRSWGLVKNFAENSAKLRTQN